MLILGNNTQRVWAALIGVRMWWMAAITLFTFQAGPAGAEEFTFFRTIGETNVIGSDNGHFFNAGNGAVDDVHGRIFIADADNQRVQIFDTQTLGYVRTLGETGVRGSDNAHFQEPSSIAFDPANNHILVTDTGNERVQVFDATDLTYVATIGRTNVPRSDNTGFNGPKSVKINAVADQIYITDTTNDRIQIYDATSFAYLATLGTAGLAGTDNQHFNLPSDALYNPVNKEILVVDSHNDRVLFFDAETLVPRSQLGVTGQVGSDNDHFFAPGYAAFDSATNLILIGDDRNQREQVFSAATHRFITTLGMTDFNNLGDDTFSGVLGVAVDPANSRVFVIDSDDSRVQAFTENPSPMVGSVLPGARSVQLGATSAVFANLLNAGPAELDNCTIALPLSAPAGLSLTYQTTDPATNAVTGMPNTPVTIPAALPGSVSPQSFVLFFDSSNAFAETGQPFEFACDGVAPVPVIPGVNTADLIFSATPVPDVIALAATAQSDGIVHVPLASAGAFAVASINIGITATVTAALDTGGATLPLTATICRTDTGGQCLAPPAGSVSLAYATNATPTFSIFVTATDAIALAPATSRIFLRFLDSDGVSHGATSVAVEAM
jgi:DNA-binding beta-propeller fold protein YncE